MPMSALHVCQCITCIPGAHRGQKRASDLLQLELWTVVNHLRGARNKPEFLCKDTTHEFFIAEPPLQF